MVGCSNAFAEPIQIINGVATMTLRRKLATGTVKVKVTLPKGWRQSDTKTDDALFVSATSTYDRPSITLNVQIDNLEEKEVPPRLKKAIAEDKKTVGGGGKIKVLKLKDRPDGGLISREINATKERDVHYVETVCLVRKPGQKFIVQLVGFAGVKEAALVAEFEAACKTVQIVEP